MDTLRIVLAEIGYRRLNFVLCVLAVTVAATLAVAGPTLVSGYKADTERILDEQREQTEEKLAAIRNETDAKLAAHEETTTKRLAKLDKETKRITRDLGFNLSIVHKDTDSSSLYLDHAIKDMPEEYVYKLANAKQIDMVRHIIATLQQPVKWNDRKVMLVGIMPEVGQAHMSEKPPMGMVVKEGMVVVGHELGRGLKKGDEIVIDGGVESRKFKITTILSEQGSQQDATLMVNLHDAQALLGKKGLVSQILALGCHCSEANLPNIRMLLAEVLPDTHITEQTTKRVARAEMRDAVTKERATALQSLKTERQSIYDAAQEQEEQHLAQIAANRKKIGGLISVLTTVLVPLVTLVCVVFVGLMTWMNVRERRVEIGVFRALGKGAGMIVSLLLGKAVLLGLAGAITGCLLGYVVAWSIGTSLVASPDVFDLNALLVLATLVGGPIIAALASYPPTMFALKQDPATVLQEP